MKKFIFSYNDDNHDPMFWFDKEYLGTDTMDIAETMFGYGMSEGEWSTTDIATLELYIFDLADFGLNDEEIDIIHEYLHKEKTIENNIWEKLTKQDWKGVVALLKAED